MCVNVSNVAGEKVTNLLEKKNTSGIFFEDTEITSALSYAMHEIKFRYKSHAIPYL